MVNDDAPLDPVSLKLDSSSIETTTPYLMTLSLEQRKALLPEARRQEAALLKEQYSQRAFYSRWTEAAWTQWAKTYSPAVLMDPLVVPTSRNIARAQTKAARQVEPKQ